MSDLNDKDWRLASLLNDLADNAQTMKNPPPAWFALRQAANMFLDTEVRADLNNMAAYAEELAGDLESARVTLKWIGDNAEQREKAEIAEYARAAAEVIAGWLAKNPNPSGHLDNESLPVADGGADRAITNRDSGLVGLGPVVPLMERSTVEAQNLRANIAEAERVGHVRLVLSHTLDEARELADWIERREAPLTVNSTEKP